MNRRQFCQKPLATSIASAYPFLTGCEQKTAAHSEDSGKGNYGPVYERLATIKGQYDPGNQFRLSRNIQPVS